MLQCLKISCVRSKVLQLTEEQRAHDVSEHPLAGGLKASTVPAVGCVEMTLKTQHYVPFNLIIMNIINTRREKE